MFLVNCLLQRCSNSSAMMTWDDIYGRDIQPAEEYSEQYITTRIFEEQQLADSIFTPGTVEEPNRVSNAASPSSQSSGTFSTHSLTSHSPSGSSPTTIVTDAGSSILPTRLARCSHKGCKKTYRGRDALVNLRRHIRCIHEAEAKGKQWKCPGINCELNTARRDNLRVHFKRKHKDEAMPHWLKDQKRS